jgi:hypothetical protein
MAGSTPGSRPRLTSDTSSITEEDGKLQDKLNDLKMPATFVPGQVIVTPDPPHPIMQSRAKKSKECMDWPHKMVLISTVVFLMFLWTSPFTLIALILSVKAVAEMKKGETKKAQKLVKIARIIVITSASIAVVTLALTLIIYLGVVPAVIRSQRS